MCAEDSYKNKPIYGNTREKFLSVSDTKSNPLCGILPLSIGMKIALTVNICTNDGMVNGAQGILRNIIYNSESSIQENQTNNKKVITFDKPPKFVVIELLNNEPGSYEQLPPKHVPIYPIKRKCKYTCKTRDGSEITHEFQRIQLPITPAFALTEFKCQGTTLKKIIVDLEGGKIGAGVYVMLSRVKKLEDIVILRPFNQTKLNIKIDPDLKKEIERLKKYSKITDHLPI